MIGLRKGIVAAICGLLTLSAGPRLRAEPVRLLFGLDPDKLSTNVIRFYPGSIADYYGARVYNFTSAQDVDLTVNGLGGLDTGSPTNGYDYFFYLVRQVSNPANARLIASHEKFAGDVVYPSGWEFARKLPFGIRYNSAWDGIPDFHTTGWPARPCVTYTQSEAAALWTALGGAASASFTDVDLSPWIPDNARLARLLVEVRYNTGTAGSGYLRSYSAQSTGVLVGSASPGSPFPGVMSLDLRATSTLQVQYKTTGSVQMYMFVSGYCMTEPA